MLSAATAHAQADDFPSKPIRLVVPFAAGGTMDLFGRLVGGEMAKALNQTVVVENLPGAGGSIATGNVARSAPDGYSLCFCATGTILVNAEKGAPNLAALTSKARPAAVKRACL